MDGKRFDDLSRIVGAAPSRRAVLKGLLGGLATGLAALTRQDTATAQGGAPGTPCTRARDCAAFHCVDGSCCDTACTGQCEACNVEGALGTCTPVTGQPVAPRPPCPGTDICQASCDGTTRDQCTLYPGLDVVCADPVCEAGWLTTYGCGGNGTCHPTTTRCESGACIGAECSCGNLVLAGGSNPTDPIEVDDDLTVYLNRTPIFTDTNGLQDFHPPLSIPGRFGDQLRVVATDVLGFDWALSPLYLHCVGTGVVQVLDAVGFRRCCLEPIGGVFYDETFTIAI